MRVIAMLIAATVLLGCTQAARPQIFVDGRLAHAAFIEIAGTPEEVGVIAAQAREQGWTVDCEGTAGENATLRLRFPPGTSRAAIEAYFADIRQPRGFKNQMVYEGMRRSVGCVTLP